MKHLALLILALSLAWTAGGQDEAYWLTQAARDYSNGTYPLALDDIDNYIEMNSSDVNGWITKADILLKMKRYRDADECLDQVIMLDESNTVAWNDKGLILAGALGDLDGGLEALNRAVDIDPTSANSWYNRGLVLEKMERYEEALESFTRATEQNPSLSNAWLHQGEVLMKLGDSQAAASAFDRVTELEPENKDAWMSKGSALQALGRGQEAMEAFAKAGMMPGR